MKLDRFKYETVSFKLTNRKTPLIVKFKRPIILLVVVSYPPIRAVC